MFLSSPWIRYVTIAVTIAVAYVVATVTGAPEAVTTSLSAVSVAAGLTAAILGIRLYRPRTLWPWLLAASLLLAAVGTLLPPGVLNGDAPSAADACFLSVTTGGAVTLLLILRKRNPGRDLAGLLDAAIITVSAGLFWWIFLIDPIVGGTDVELTTRLVAAAYPLGDLMLAALGARLLLDTGRKSVAVYSITGYLGLTVVPDTISTLGTLSGSTRGHALAAVLWVVSPLVLGLSCMHPSMRDLDAPSAVPTPDMGPLRLTTLALASLLAPATLLVQFLRGAPLHVPLICATCGVLFLLVIGRLAGLVGDMRRMATTDGLTGLRTRRHFQEALAHAGHRDHAVILFDIDHFKRVNDTYGHDGGDRVLREVGARLGDAVRAQDVIARYGGEEFAVLLPHTSPAEAHLVAARIHAAVRATPIPVTATESITVTVSVGVACTPTDVTDSAGLPLLADQLLYQAKESGRDQVAVAA
ncbi:GGDEF domain-containing protein [Actinoplanes sp. NPDC020271]|uniref:GGDEF domain-containing protein n=1 Tax=Actinoplanes sp. NPDC020271 TaxID=3363896 RepID=UPI00379EBC87